MTNFVYQFIGKPTEIFFPVSHALNKLPAKTWRQYGPLFNQYSTTAIPPELLAALAQVESAGNPIAHTYWRWRLTWHPFEIYQPASSAVGMYQMTDAAFADARHYCIRHHTVIEDKGWSIWHSCWFNAFYFRVLPSHAIELTAVSLERNGNSEFATEGGSRSDHPSVRRWSCHDLCPPRLSAAIRRALRRPQRRLLSCRGERPEAAVPAPCRRKID